MLLGRFGILNRELDFLCVFEKQNHLTERTSRDDFHGLDCLREVSFPVLANPTAFRSGSRSKPG
jgi:hypothetical protein